MSTATMDLIPYTFHPKVYLFKSVQQCSSAACGLIVGSGNLTGGGLFTNYEGTLVLTLDASAERSRYDKAGLIRTVSRIADSIKPPSPAA